MVAGAGRASEPTLARGAGGGAGGGQTADDGGGIAHLADDGQGRDGFCQRRGGDHDILFRRGAWRRNACCAGNAQYARCDLAGGITAIVANDAAGAAGLDEAEALLSAVGAVVRLSHEAQIDAVTGVSGSGPAYVFHMIETMAAAGEAQGLPSRTINAAGQGNRGRGRGLGHSSGGKPNTVAG